MIKTLIKLKILKFILIGVVSAAYVFKRYCNKKNEVQGKKGMLGYRIEPWLKTTKEDMFMIDLSDIY